MNKKISLGCILLTFIAPVISVMGCNQVNILRKNLRIHEYLLEKSVQDSKSRVHLDLSNIQRENIDDFSVSLNGIYNSKMAASGYGEIRHFYHPDKKTFSVHTGVDVFLNQGQKILAPNGAEIIAASFVNQNQEWAQGIGGILCLRMKISKLNIDSNLKEYVYVQKGKKYFRVPKLSFSENGIYNEQDFSTLKFVAKKDYDNYLSKMSLANRNSWQKDSEYIYVSMIHLSSQSINLLSQDIKKFINNKYKKPFNCKIAMDIDINNPKVIKKGETIAYIGSPLENGGWSPHVHVNAYSVLSSKMQLFKKYKLNKFLSNNNLFSYIFMTRPVGVYQYSSKPEPSQKQSVLELKSKGIFDPNEIFNFYQNDDKKIVLKNL